MSVSASPGRPGDGSEALVAAGYDAVYAGAARSPTLQRIWQEAASGVDYPPEFGNISFVTVAELSQLARETHLDAEDLLVDLACGAGGPGLWVARERSARLIGIDLSAAGVEAAATRARTVGLEKRASFRVGSFAATGLEDGCAGAAMTVDALQYAPSKADAVTEVARVLRPGGRFVFTAFEVEPGRVVDLPVLGDDPIADYRPVLQAAGFVVDAYEETPGWWLTMKAAYWRVLGAADTLSQEMGPAAIAALGSEMTVTLEIEPYRRRVLAVSTRA